MPPIRVAASLAVLAAAIVVAACAHSGARTSTAAAAAPPPVACRPGDRSLSFTVDDKRYKALVHVPKARGRLPVVLAFHGARYGADFVSAYYGFRRVSDREGFLVVYPQASHNVFWQLPANQTEDVAAVRALLGRLQALPCVNSRRIYATGASNGGGFTARLGCEMADRLAAIAPVAGGYAPLGPCRPARPLPVFEIHGTRDQVVPYNGRGADQHGSVARFLGQWTKLDGCRGPATRRVVAPGVLRLLWTQCAGGSVVEHLRLARTNHGWPGGDTEAAGMHNYPIPSEDPTHVNAAEVVWDFLSRFTLPARSAG